MPYSSTAGKDWIRARIPVVGKIARVLDVGVGEGHYSNLFRPCYPDAEWVGVEIWGPYIEKFGLEMKYDKLILSDIRWLDFTKLGQFDICFCGDIIEHMTIVEAKAIVDQLLCCSRLVFASVPIGVYPQQPVFGNPFEQHIVDDYSDEKFRKLFPGIVDGVIETVDIWTVGAYALTRDAQVIGALRAHTA